MNPLFLTIFCISLINSFETKANQWNSLSDCVTNFPDFHYDAVVPSFDSVPALKHEFPHAAAIGWSRPRSTFIKWACGGSLISEDTVLTAAHCTINRRRIAPDVVRLGDLNLDTDDDDNDTQQFGVKSIIRHPNYTARYNDIALIKLSTRVEVTEFVTPVCLWGMNDLPYGIKLEACGFGQTEFLGDISPVLNKITVTPVTTDECQEHYEDDRKLKQGLIDEIHLCADDKTETRMDTCDGDSGGPLEMKLDYHFSVVPFQVGVTAFGKGCGSDLPGVYTKVSTYVSWIKQHVPEVETDVKACGNKYIEFRVTDYNYVLFGFESQKNVLGTHSQESTTAIILTDTYLLGIASELQKMSNPNRVELLSSKNPVMIDKIIFHPNYVEGDFEHNLALIKLKSKIRWFQHDYPTCFANDTVKGGPILQQEIFKDIGNKKHQEVQITSIDDCINAIHLNIKKSSNTNLFCVKNDIHHVPTSCDISPGSPVFLNDFPETPRLSIVKGLVLTTQDCTFTLALNITQHFDWINSVVFDGHPSS